MCLSRHQLLLLMTTLLAFLAQQQHCATASAFHPSCPVNTLASRPFNMPNGTSCHLCSQFVGICSSSCTGTRNGPATCVVDPDGCGVFVCPDPSLPNPPTPVPPPPPPPTSPTPNEVEPPADIGTPEQCGIDIQVGCVIHSTADTTSPIDCNDYAPKSGNDCRVMARWTYLARISAPPTNAIFRSAMRYRDTASSLLGNPVSYQDHWVGQNLTPTRLTWRQISATEAETTDFCSPDSSVTTTFQIVTDGGDSELSECRVSGSYELVTQTRPSVSILSGEDDPAPSTSVEEAAGVTLVVDEDAATSTGVNIGVQTYAVVGLAVVSAISFL